MRITTLLLALLVFGTTASHAQDWLLIEGLADGELWATDANSIALSRNDGYPAVAARLRLWTAIELHPTLFLYALGEFESELEFGDPRIGAEAELEQMAARFSPTAALTVEAGKIESVVGTFQQRRFSNRNPLIGSPDAYPVLYPWGAKIGGTVGRFDYRASFESLPVVNTRYVPEPSQHLRPGLGGGYTPIPGLRLGLSATMGPYLSEDLSGLMPAGSTWTDFHQRLLAFDLRYSTGHLETYAELALSGYDVPTAAEPLSGFAYYVEAKYTWRSRLFTAVRFEQNDYAFVRPDTSGTWTARRTNFFNAEVGFGYRLGSHTIAKMSYRQDEWPDAELSPFLANGYAFAVQVSHQFDLLSALRGRY